MLHSAIAIAEFEGKDKSIRLVLGGIMSPIHKINAKNLVEWNVNEINKYGNEI